MLNIVIPMAGAGSRFKKAGYAKPKPLIDVFGRPMIEIVIKNLTPQQDHRFIFICQKEHVRQYSLKNLFNTITQRFHIIEIDGLTEGAACTVLTASELIDSDDPLMIANSDQYIEADINSYLLKMQELSLDGLIMTMWADDKKWSFVSLDHQGYVNKVVEKEVISNEATVGVYNFARGSDFVNAAKKMISLKLSVNHEYYVAPCYNLMLAGGAKIGTANIGRLGKGMHGLGTPADLIAFLGSSISIVPAA